MISHYHFYDDKKEKNLNYSGLKKITEGIFGVVRHLREREENARRTSFSHYRDGRNDGRSDARSDDFPRYDRYDDRGSHKNNRARNDRKHNQNDGYERKHQSKKQYESQDDSQYDSQESIEMNFDPNKSILGDYDPKKEERISRKNREKEEKEAKRKENIKIKPSVPAKKLTYDNKQKDNVKPNISEKERRKKESEVNAKKIQNRRDNRIMSDIEDEDIKELQDKFDSFLIRSEKVGLIIGKEGKMVNRIMDDTRTKIWVDDQNIDKDSGYTPIVVRGENKNDRDDAYKKIKEIIRSSMALDNYQKTRENLNEAFSQDGSEESATYNDNIIPLSGQKANRKNQKDKKRKRRSHDKHMRGKFERGSITDSDSDDDEETEDDDTQRKR